MKVGESIKSQMIGFTNPNTFYSRCDDMLIKNIPFTTEVRVTPKGNFMFLIKKVTTININNN